MNRKKFISTLTFNLSGLLTFGNDKFSDCIIKTRRICNICQFKLGKNIYFEKGVKDVKVDWIKDTIRISYDATKTNPEKLKQYIISIGYDADELKADVKKRELLRYCCESNITICK
ncbi:heavy-metal-associated domain-containing protein [Emticicia sp. C21]|uniref:heavy-metal-associated domain-containing protein n=1 Tax=Emticicia sp. C21 TaxID=2302915 RepID=UPI000E344BA1|nr:heavy-metal-associated domain-containing protein [Emticicia sp. C21]RFS17470.1 cation transporter [Emticicia sp. C21]